MLSLQQSILDTLRAIEENTADSLKPAKGEAKSTGFGDLISGMVPKFIKNMLGGLMSALSPKAIFAVLKRLALPVLIVTTLVSGLMDGFKEFQKSRSISKAIIAGLGGIIEVLSFGLLDVESVKTSIEAFKTAFNTVVDAFSEYVVQPIMDYVITPLHDFFMSVKDSIMNTLQKISIPKIEFTIPVIDKKVAIGPFEPFKAFKSSEAAPVSNPTASVIVQKTAELADTKDKKKDAPSSNNIVSAPVTTVSSTQNAINFGRKTRTADPLYTFRSL